MTKITKPVRVARYARVSRADQNSSLQLDETAQLIEHRGWKLVATYTDEGVSGSRDRRPELDQMMTAARKGKFDVLVVWRSDRLFRSLRHMVVALDELAARNVDFVSVTESFDTTTPQGRLLLHLVSAFAEFERNLLIERTKAGMAAAKRRGSPIGRPRVRVDAPRARLMRAQGLSLREIGRKLGVSASSVRRVLLEVE